MYVRNGNIVGTANGHSSSNSEITTPKCCNILFPDTSLHSAGTFNKDFQFVHMMNLFLCNVFNYYYFSDITNIKCMWNNVF